MAYVILEKCIGCGVCVKICPAASISGSKKQLHIIDRFTCIDCGACGRICPAGAVEDMFGQKTVRINKKDWLKPVVDVEKCMVCGMCIDACPTDALGAGSPSRGNGRCVSFPELLHAESCLGCGLCVPECPVEAITMC